MTNLVSPRHTVASFVYFIDGEPVAVNINVHARHNNRYEVYVLGGVLANGEDSWVTDDLHDAIKRAADEVESAILGM